MRSSGKFQGARSRLATIAAILHTAGRLVGTPSLVFIVFYFEGTLSTVRRRCANLVLSARHLVVNA